MSERSQGGVREAAMHPEGLVPIVRVHHHAEARMKAVHEPVALEGGSVGFVAGRDNRLQSRAVLSNLVVAEIARFRVIIHVFFQGSQSRANANNSLSPLRSP